MQPNCDSAVVERSQARLAENEAVFRRANEHIDAKADELDPDGEHTFLFLCECAQADCVDRVPLTRAEYEHVRSDPTQFLIIPGHEVVAIEQVVEDEGEYQVVEKVGGAAQIAVATDPRS